MCTFTLLDIFEKSEESANLEFTKIHTQMDLTKAIIEITHTQGVKKDAQKLQELMQVYDIPEGFIYDYKLGIWYKYDLQKGEQKENSSWCSAVGVDLAKLLF